MLTALKQIVARCRAFFKNRQLDSDFKQEWETHLSMLIEDNLRRGMSSQEARRAALVRLGGRESLQEQHRQIRGLPAIDTILQDLRFALRLIRKEPWFSSAVVVALALGIGVNAIGFTIVNAAFLRGLPFEQADRLYVLLWQTRSHPISNFSTIELEELRARSHTFAGLSGYTSFPMNVSDDQTWPEQVRGAQITANTFSVLRQKPIFGRDFALEEDRKGADRVVVIGYRIWKNRYGADPEIIGKNLRIDGEPAKVIGVMPDNMNFPDNNDLWLPFIPTKGQEQRTARPLRVFGRLKDGVDPRAAEQDLSRIAQQLKAAYPDSNENLLGGHIETFTERFVGGPARIFLLVTMGAVSLVLLVACANVANLLLSRSAHRAREISMRMALGATRWRVVRQLLIESVVLGFIGGGFGLVLALVGVSLFDSAVQDPGKPYWIVFTADWVVFGYVAGICVLTAIIFGLAPALHVSKANNNETLREGGRGITGTRRARRLSGSFVIAELALSLIMLAGGGLIVRSFVQLYNLDVGFPTDYLSAMRMQLPFSRYVDPEARLRFFRELESRAMALPGVESVAVTTGVPPADGGSRVLEIDGPGRDDQGPPQWVSIVTIEPQFFSVLGVQLLRGRNLTDVDGAPGSEAVIINERLASQFFPGQDPIGKRLRLRQERNTGQPAPAWRTIVGLSPSIRQGDRENAYHTAVVYVPYRQEAPTAVSLLVRTRLPTVNIMNAIRREVQAMDRDQPVLSIQTMDEILEENRWPYRVFGSLFATLSAIALALSSVGLYAVMAYSVTQQTQQIGVRMALGAQRTQVSWLILKRGLAQIAIGLGLGLPGALALSRVLSGVLFEIGPSDPLTLSVITMLLSIVCLAACLVPVFAATRIDPLVALRAD
jgi:putative ABC transport system permease protein